MVVCSSYEEILQPFEIFILISNCFILKGHTRVTCFNNWVEMLVGRVQLSLLYLLWHCEAPSYLLSTMEDKTSAVWDTEGVCVCLCLCESDMHVPTLLEAKPFNPSLRSASIAPWKRPKHNTITIWTNGSRGFMLSLRLLLNQLRNSQWAGRGVCVCVWGGGGLLSASPSSCRPQVTPVSP